MVLHDTDHVATEQFVRGCGQIYPCEMHATMKSAHDCIYPGRERLFIQLAASLPRLAFSPKA
jgi:hypothetical protein